MAVLSEAERVELLKDWQADYLKGLGSLAITKAELRAALDGMDGWIHANAAAFNAAIPQPARGALNAGQKAWFFARLVERRYLKGL